uniref:DNA protection during starvation protein-like protein, dodecamer, Iron-binding protein n=1 Tax=Siphoviridae sp. ctsIQ24 TaxID=2826484 RepID=A0A8S5MQ21_9CAUD|nr:MAG TPA: DNA protection during starvation protein-like protein, dodecamer, Iron-binding protein [Siphoviridae sp. ctsIQ24]
MGVLVRLYYVAVCLANDMKHIHTHIKGRKFDMIHNICNEYYEKASKDADDLVELAIEYDESVMNASYAAELIKYNPANLKAYNYEEAINTVYNSISYYVEELENALATNFDSDVENLLQEYLRYWKKENNYKNKARMEV